MSEWICTLCGERAYSKCVDQRSVVVANNAAVALRNGLAVHTINYGGKTEAFYNLTLWDNCSHFEAVEEFKKFLGTDGDIIEQALCDHNWVLTEGTTCNLQCTHENMENFTPPDNSTKYDTLTAVIKHAMYVDSREKRLKMKSRAMKTASDIMQSKFKKVVTAFYETLEAEILKEAALLLWEDLYDYGWHLDSELWSKTFETGEAFYITKETIRYIKDEPSNIRRKEDYLKEHKDFDINSVSYDVRKELDLAFDYFNLNSEEN